MEVFNQRDFVAAELRSMTPKERDQFALEAGTTTRTLYNIMDPERKPGYDTVYLAFKALLQRQGARQ